jgi:hypothetical protein
MVKHIGRLRRNSVCIGEYHLRNMEALAWWIHDDQRCCNREIYAEEFDVEIMEACLNELELESKEEMDEEIMLSKFKDTFTGYIQWDVELINYLSGLKGKSGVPLVYVIHKNETVDQEFLLMVDELLLSRRRHWPEQYSRKTRGE